MNLTLLSVLNFFQKKNRFRITAKLADKAASNLLRRPSGCQPLGSVDYLLINMHLDPSNKDDFLSSVHSGLMQTRDAANKGQSHWHKHKFTQEYRTDRLLLDPKIEIYYRKLGLAKSGHKTTLGESAQPKLSWDS